MRMIIGFFFIAIAIGGLYFHQHPDQFAPALDSSVETIKGIVNKDSKKKNLTSTIKLPKIPLLKNGASELSLIPLEKKSKTFTKEQMGSFYYSYIHSLYEEILDRVPTSEEEEKWMNTLMQGASEEGVYRGVILSTEYLEKAFDENYPEASDPYIAFAGYYAKNYLGVALPPEMIKNRNPYKISKELVNKSLELIDYFAAKDLPALYSWYAVLSSDLATRFKIWDPQKEKMRTLTAPETHYKWAEISSYGLIKTEIIIKLHKVFNRI